jgi:putative transcriptional regulator
MALTRLAWIVALTLAASVLAAAAPGPGQAPGGESLAGQFLVATPEMGDPRFAETVILMVRHDETGALGIVINRPVEERPLASLLAALGEPNAGVTGTVRLFAGGPVDPTVGFVVHSAEYRRDETLAIDGRIAVTASRAILLDIGHGTGPHQSLVAFGYAGWGPGQLELEMAQRSWFTEPEDPRLIFDDDRDKVWKEALDRRSRAL